MNDLIPAAKTVLTANDILGAWKVRFGIGRTTYKVTPGLYAVGTPDFDSPVLVSANYKLTFDTLRKNLSGISCWLLILDTDGVNVWCSAGKGTFGTRELINQVEQTGLAGLVSHRCLILPQLGAANMKAHEVFQKTGFTIIYGPVRAEDIKAFLGFGMKATAEMRTVRFTIKDRLVLTPVEFIAAAQKLIIVFGVMFLLNLLAKIPFGFFDFLVCIGAVAVGTVVVPVLLPWIPGRAFSFKGWLAGLVWTAAALWSFGWFARGLALCTTGYLLLLPAVSAWLSLNFTGASTYTSSSGVQKEMRISLPMLACASIGGASLILAWHLFFGI